MNAPLIWVVLPGIYAVVLLILRRSERAVALMGILVSLLLAGFAWIEPIGKALTIGPYRIELGDTLFFLGRRFVISASDAPVLILIYLGLAFWLGGSIVARAGSSFVPIGMGIAALLTAAIAVEPFLYAALLIELVTIICVPLVSPPGKPVGRGALRFLTFQTLAMPLILFTGWMLEGVEAAPAELLIIQHGLFLLGIGFAFLLAIFPFHTWVPMIAEETNPYIAAFIFYIYSLGITFFGISFLERYAWLRNLPDLFVLLQLVGTIMVIISGLWAAFQTNLARMMGYAFLLETGIALLTVSIGAEASTLPASLGILFASLLPRGLAFGLWALAMVAITRVGNQVDTHEFRLSFSKLYGAARKAPIASGILVLSIFSLAGFPLLAGFPIRLALWEALGQKSTVAVIVALLGSVGLMIGGLRSLANLIAGEETVLWNLSEDWGERFLLLVGGLTLILVGIFPQWFLTALAQLARVYLGIVP